MLTKAVYHRLVDGMGACGYGFHARQHHRTLDLVLDEAEAIERGGRRCRICWPLGNSPS